MRSRQKAVVRAQSMSVIARFTSTPIGNGMVVLELVGDADLVIRHELDGAIRSALCDGHDLIVDLSEVTFVDAAVIRRLIAAHHEAAGRGTAVVLQFGPAGFVERVLELTGVTEMLPCAATGDEAIRWLRARTNGAGIVRTPLLAVGEAT